MYYVITYLAGLFVGAICMFVYVAVRLAKVKQRERILESESKQARVTLQAAKDHEASMSGQFAERQIELTRRDAELHQRTSEQIRQSAELEQRVKEFESRTISYRELQQENILLKKDLQNIDINLRKLDLDGELRDQRQRELDERSAQLAKRYLADTVKDITSSMGPNNFSANKQKLLEVIARCREIGFEITGETEAKLLLDLRAEFERAVRAAFAREEQSRIKAQIREEERLRREIDRELKQLDRELAAIKAALDKAMEEAKGQHTAEVERLQARLAEAEEKSNRAISMAEQTKAGYVYVLSNVGTLGEGVFKVGMTCRLDPMERVYELGSASVPFPFDVHAMISCKDAPSLEAALHRALRKRRVNRARPRKEFFRTTIDELREIVRGNHDGEIDYVAEPEALEYRQSLTMSDEDAEYIESVYDAVDEENETAVGSEPD